jgi:hypothetical protein
MNYNDKQKKIMNSNKQLLPYFCQKQLVCIHQWKLIDYFILWQKLVVLRICFFSFVKVVLFKKYSSLTH